MLHAGMYPTPAGLPPAQMVPQISPQPPQGNPESVPQLLARGYTLPCSTAAQAFTHMVPPMNRFPVALEVLLPILESSQSEVRRKAVDNHPTTAIRTTLHDGGWGCGPGRVALTEG